jgi:ABC-type nitrate/sulfonate/bicarbonate transport system substrate-binding protein
MEIKLGGVPEHFNYPWHLAIEEGVFEDAGIDLIFKDFAGGTGAMTEALKNKEIDLALLLTEGAVKFISENKGYKILKVYVDSPLLWGVHLAAKTSKENLEKLPFAISRLGSGSHLMAYVYAKSKKWNLQTIDFKIVSNLDGARNAYKEGLDALFLWEKFTTQPFVTNNEMQRVDVCPTPWSCFVLVAHESFLDENLEELELLLDGINFCLDDFKSRPNIEEEIAENYQLELSQVKEWLAITDWNSSNEVSKPMLETVIQTLFDLKLINQKPTPQSIISKLTTLED